MRRGAADSLEILAPAGSEESLLAAVRCGAGAVYLGSKDLNARRGADNFDQAQLERAVSLCRVRDVAVHLTLNTIVFDDERPLLEEALSGACRAGVDALIIQDLAVLKAARSCAPGLPLHASTQMAVHSLDGVKQLEQVGFSRVVLARELSLKELEYIAAHSPLPLEVFVHGALCMCVSGQCYLSAMIGGRSGNRGLCAQPCRLPFASGSSSHALSLKDLSLIDSLPLLRDMGIASAKIEGRLKRPEYVAAAVTACRAVLDGREADTGMLRAVFSRNGFTTGYLDGKLGDGMFGTRQKEDVQSAAGVLKELQRLYDRERQAVAVDMALAIRAGTPSSLLLRDGRGNEVAVKGPVPQEARTAPTTAERAQAALSKTGGTPFALRKLDCDIGEGLMLPASALNAMRREALEKLEAFRAQPPGIAYLSAMPEPAPPVAPLSPPAFRVRVANAGQLTAGLVSGADRVILPLGQIGSLPDGWQAVPAGKLLVELPRIDFSDGAQTRALLRRARELGAAGAVSGNLAGIYISREMGLPVHGDFSLNIANTDAVDTCRELGLADITLSPELELGRLRAMQPCLPVGIIAGGRLPLMVTRNRPAGAQDDGVLTDRLGNRFPLLREGDCTQLLNTVPLYLADRLGEFQKVSFFTLYFTVETPEECAEMLLRYKSGAALDGPKTRGLFYRKVL